MKIRMLIVSLTTFLLCCGCSLSHKPEVAGRYSRTVSGPGAGAYPAYKYTNSTELKSDGTYIDSTDRGGSYKVLETGTYQVDNGKITFYPQDAPQPDRGRVYTFKDNVIFPGRFQRVRE